MTTAFAPSEKQINYLLSLANERLVPTWGDSPADRIQHVRKALATAPDSSEVSDWIGWLRRQPMAPSTADQLTPGVYETAGQVYVVKPNRDKTRLYAKVLVESAARMNEDGDVVGFELEYAPGAIHRIRPEDRMERARAEELTIRYGRCIACGRRLKAAESVSRGIGPVCAKAFA